MHLAILCDGFLQDSQSCFNLPSLAMDLTCETLTVVSTDGSYFGADTAYLVDLSTLSDEEVADFQDGSDNDRAAYAAFRGKKLSDTLASEEVPFVSKHLLYRSDWIYDEDKPEFAYFIPCDSGNFWIVDCWIVDEEGNVHPDYNVAGVPVGTKGFVAIADSPRIMD